LPTGRPWIPQCETPRAGVPVGASVPLTVVVGRTVAVMVVSTIAVEAGVMAVSITVVDQVEVMVGVTTRVLVVVMLVRDTITVVAGAVFEEVKTE